MHSSLYICVVVYIVYLYISSVHAYVFRVTYACEDRLVR
jgi:hypothetical protein